MSASRTRRGIDEESPQVPAQVTPAMGQHIGGDHSFTLQAIMELQRSTGELRSSVQSLKESIEKLDANIERSQQRMEGRIDRFDEKISGVTHKIYAAGVVLVILLAVGGFIVNKAWDLMAEQITIQKK